MVIGNFCEKVALPTKGVVTHKFKTTGYNDAKYLRYHAQMALDR